jgi:integrase
MAVRKRPPRGKGEGSLTGPDARGLYTSRIELPTANGERRRLTKRSKDKRALNAYHLAKIAELKEHGDLPSSSPRFETFLPHWIAEKAKKRTPNTINNYRSVTNAWLIPMLGKKKVADVTPKDIRAVTNAVLAAGNTSTYALNVHRVLSSALTFARDEGIRTTNPAKNMSAPSKSKADLQAFTALEAVTALEYILEHEPDAARWATSLLTGARRGEIIGLERDRVTDVLDLSWQLQRIVWEHGCGPVTLTEKKIRGVVKKVRVGKCGFVRAHACPDKKLTLPPDYEHRHVEGGLYLTRPKSSDGWRVVPLVEPLRSIIHRHMEATDGRFVFARPDGRPHDPRDDSAAWRQVLLRSGIDKDVRLHDLRHTAVLLLRAAGVEWDVIRMILGHATIMQSMSYLPKADANDPRLRDAMEAMSGHFTTKEISP